MSLSERNPYEVHAELEQRMAKLEAEVERLRQAVGDISAALERAEIDV